MGNTADSLRRNGRVWIVEHNRSVAQLDAAQYGMLLARYNYSGGHSVLPAKFLSSLGSSYRAQRMADLEYYVHGSRHLLASICQATGAEAIIGASAVTYNSHFTSTIRTSPRKSFCVLVWRESHCIIVAV